MLLPFPVGAWLSVYIPLDSKKTKTYRANMVVNTTSVLKVTQTVRRYRERCPCKLSKRV